MKNYLIVLLVSMAFITYGQKKDSKSEKASERIAGTWVANSATYINSNTKRKPSDFPNDTYVFNPEGTFTLTSITQEKDVQIIKGNWNIGDNGKTISLSGLDSDGPIESKNNEWFFVINVTGKNLSIAYRIKGNNKADLSTDQKVTNINFNREN